MLKLTLGAKLALAPTWKYFHFGEEKWLYSSTITAIG